MVAARHPPTLVGSPTQIWEQLSADVQGQVIRLLAELAAHVLATEVEHPPKEVPDAFPIGSQQNPA